AMERAQKIELGAAIRKARQEQQLTQFTLAIRAGCSPPTIWFCEHDAASETMLAKVAKALRVKLPKNDAHKVSP
ncbi:MAG TPA: helix-turn-helix transcriptional regulator, partial [Anaeromyxobacter sp.]